MRCLGKAVEGMLAGFDRPDDEDVKHLGVTACHSAGEDGCGKAVVTLSGWLTCFCWWNSDWTKQRMYNGKELRGMWHLGGPDAWKRLRTDGAVFPVMDKRKIPSASQRPGHLG